MAGSGNRWLRFRRQKTHSRQDQETGGSEWQGQVTGGSDSGDRRIIADRIRRQEDRSDRIRRQKTHSRQDQETGGSE